MISLRWSHTDFRPFAAAGFALMLTGTWLTISINREPALQQELRVPLNGYVYASYALAICATAWLLRWQRAVGDQGSVEGELRVVRNQLLTLAEQAGVSLLVFDGGGRLVETLGPELRSLGLGPQRTTLRDLFEEETPVIHELEHTLRTGRPASGVVISRGRILKVDARPRPAAEGGRDGLLVAVRDETQARADREALTRGRRDLERCRAALDFHRREALTPTAMFDPDGRMVDANPALCRTLGYAREELLRQSTEDLTHPEDIGRSIETILTLRGGPSDHATIRKRYLHKDGASVEVVTHLALRRDEDGRILGVMAQLAATDADDAA